MYVPTHNHSFFSIADGLFSPRQWAKAYKERGYKAAALTDHGTLAGVIPFYHAMKEEGLKPVIGCEFYFVDDPTIKEEANRSAAHLILLAKDEEGWRNLLKLSRLSYEDGFYYRPRIGVDWLTRHSGGLICQTACLGGVLSREVWREKDKKESMGLVKRFRQFKEIFGDDLYVEFQGHDGDDQRMVNDVFIKTLSTLSGFKHVLCNDSHYILPEHAKIQLLIKSSAFNNKEAAASYTHFDSLWLKKPKDVYETFREHHEELPQAFVIAGMQSTEEILEKCRNFALPKKQYLPRYSDDQGFFRRLTTDKLKEFLAKGDFRWATREQYLERFQKEYMVMTNLGFQDYFLLVWDIVEWAKSQGIYVGIGRGSSAGSFICYLLGIVKINPLQYHLIFERMLNEHRHEMPDIDMDFESLRRDEVKSYVFKKYGKDHVCEIGTYGRMMLKTAIVDFGKQFGYPVHELLQITTTLGLDKTEAQSLDAAMESSPRLRAMMHEHPEYENAVKASIGQIKSQSIHPAGVLICSDALDTVTPLKTQKKTDKTKTGKDKDQRVTVTQAEDKHVIGQGLIKMDFLGLKEYDIFRFVIEQNVVGLTMENYIDTIHEAELVKPDRAVWNLFREGKTEAVFQFSCLSGDTIICTKTKKTIKDIHEQKMSKHGTTQPIALLLDEGSWRRSAIKAIKSTGMKQTYRLVTKDRRFIRATAEHKFLTESGWKSLSELRPGDKVGFKADWGDPRLDGLRLCSDCRVEKLSGSKRCYACSARYHNNPSHHREKLRVLKSIKNNWAKGGIAKDKLAVMLKKRAVTWEKTLASGWTNPLKGKKRPEISGRNNPMFGRTTRSHMGFREDLGHFVRSTWEADYCRVLRHLGVEYQYEPKTFDLGEMTYTPDFYLPSEDKYVEIKGWMTEKSARKIQLFREKFPNKRLDVVNKTEFAEMALKYKHLVAWECPRFPLGFVWEEVESIEPYGEEETFDLCMANSAHNYVANGFVTHNSDGMKKLLIDMKADSLADLIAAVALYRPGCLENDWHTMYYRRKAGEEAVEYLHPILEKVLSSTYGVVIYQEQFMEVFHLLGDIPMSDADTIRSALGKKDAEKLAKFATQFVEGAAKKVGEKAAREIWDQLQKASGYTFNRSHSAAYGLVAYISQWFKVHSPAAYWCAVVDWNCRKKEVEILANKRAANEMGIVFMMPDINESKMNFVLDEKTKMPRWSFAGISGIGDKTAECIVKGQPYKSVDDFLKRVRGVNVNNKLSLAYAGAFDNLCDRVQALDKIYQTAKKKKKPRLTHSHLLSSYYQAMGFFEAKLKTIYTGISKNCFSAAEVRETEAGEPCLVAGMVSEIKRIKTKKGDVMAKVNIVDSDEAFELTIFPTTWSITASEFKIGNVVQVAGHKSNYGGRHQIEVEEVEVVTE